MLDFKVVPWLLSWSKHGLSQNFRKKGTILRLPVFGYEEVLGGLKSHDNENQCFVLDQGLLDYVDK